MSEERVPEVYERLYARQRFGIKLGLDLTRAMLERLGNPHDRFRSIHIAGTNGKGAVCAMTDAILRAAGVRTGLYTSPHLVRFNERYSINGIAVADPVLSRLAEDVESAARSVEASWGREATFFECGTVLAFRLFADTGMEWAVVETGMGGRLDSTNVLDPDVAGITRVDLDHMQYLGSTLAAIAGEKAGIIKPGRPVVCGRMAPEAERVIRSVAERVGARFVLARDRVSVVLRSMDLTGIVCRVQAFGEDWGDICVALTGAHQVENLEVALACLGVLRERGLTCLTRDAVVTGLGVVRWPGRLQLLRRNPALIVDGAHNPCGARSLVAALKAIGGAKPIGLVVGMCRDKDGASFMKEVAGLPERMWTVPIRNERSESSDELARIAGESGLRAVPASLESALAAARAWATASDGVVCVAGSLFLAGEVLELEQAGRLDWCDIGN